MVCNIETNMVKSVNIQNLTSYITTQICFWKKLEKKYLREITLISLNKRMTYLSPGNLAQYLLIRLIQESQVTVGPVDETRYTSVSKEQLFGMQRR